MRTLLAPLELDGTIDSSQLELLLANLESAGWQEREVDLVISKCLGERKKRYFENLREMSETTLKLGKVSRALDKDFQASLKQDTQVGNTYVYGYTVDYWCRHTDVFLLTRSVTLSRMPPTEQC